MNPFTDCETGPPRRMIVEPLPDRYATDRSTPVSPIATPQGNPEGRGEVTIEHPVRKYVATIPVSVEVLQDGVYAARALDDAFDRFWNPWKYPDRIDWPAFDPVPRLTAFVQSVRERRQRLSDAWSVLLGVERIHTHEDDEW